MRVRACVRACVGIAYWVVPFVGNSRCRPHSATRLFLFFDGAWIMDNKEDNEEESGSPKEG
jgi:hypothetical protein